MASSRRTQAIIAAVLSLIFLVVLPRWHSRLNTLFEYPAATVGDTLAPTIYPHQQYKWITENQKATYLVLISSYDYIRPLEGGYIGGEAIWALSVDIAQNPSILFAWEDRFCLTGCRHVGGSSAPRTFSPDASLPCPTCRQKQIGMALLHLGLPVYASQMMDFDLFNDLASSGSVNPDGKRRLGMKAKMLRWPSARLKIVVSFYHILGNLVKMVIASDDRAEGCWKEASCVRPENPLGAKWTLSPEAYEGDHNTYLGYSIEPQCSRHPFIPHAQRRPQAYILAKFLNYFLPDRRAWTPDFFDAAANATGLSFVMASTDPPEGLTTLPELSPSIKNIGGGLLMNQNAFYDELSRSVALVGVGDPVVSPTPYEALCLGIPFINPIWDGKDPNDRTKWFTQHDGLKHLSAPYVYNVFVGDRDGFVNAIRDAAANPIQSYVLERMKMSSVEYRLGNIIEHDWEAEAATLLAARDAGLDPGPSFTA
ncbi:hypothetical protein DFH06DRAFT_1298244 [Mycena polygramma]|nr:hypothetical protein DFH06DRAFT_1298244 [Mycena polygramma]